MTSALTDDEVESVEMAKRGVQRLIRFGNFLCRLPDNDLTLLPGGDPEFDAGFHFDIDVLILACFPALRSLPDHELYGDKWIVQRQNFFYLTDMEDESLFAMNGPGVSFNRGPQHRYRTERSYATVGWELRTFAVTRDLMRTMTIRYSRHHKTIQEWFENEKATPPALS